MKYTVRQGLRQAVAQSELAMGPYSDVLQSTVQGENGLPFACSEHSRAAELGIKLHRS